MYEGISATRDRSLAKSMLVSRINNALVGQTRRQPTGTCGQLLGGVVQRLCLKVSLCNPWLLLGLLNSRLAHTGLSGGAQAPKCNTPEKGLSA